MEDKNLVTTKANDLVGYDPNQQYGFEDTRTEDIVIPRIKVIQALSPERSEGVATEGDIIDSLTAENVKGLKFIIIKQYYTNICWNPDRNADLRMLCRSFDGVLGQDQDGANSCDACRKNQFDNTKTGRDAQPTCTSYLNFLGFFENNPMPVVLSFARTNYNEGKKLLSIAKSMRCPAWNYAYLLDSKKVTKDKNSWFIITTRMAGETTPDTRALAFKLYNDYKAAAIKADYDDGASYGTADDVDSQTANEI